MSKEKIGDKAYSLSEKIVKDIKISLFLTLLMLKMKTLNLVLVSSKPIKKKSLVLKVQIVP